jgi:hypothetical protein
MTFAVQVAVCVVLIEDGVAVTETPVTAAAGTAAVLIVAEPDLVPSCVEVAVHVPEPGADGVNTPD